jgi:type II secretory pathway pseudopilin PulG
MRNLAVNNMKKNRNAFTLVELIGAIIVILILCTIIVVVTGNARKQTLTVRVQADIEAINTAKNHWQLDHPNAVFPAAESDQFTAIQGYLDPVQAASWANFQAPGVVYTIGDLATPASSNPPF